jgi:hypothetical protein
MLSMLPRYLALTLTLRRRKAAHQAKQAQQEIPKRAMAKKSSKEQSFEHLSPLDSCVFRTFIHFIE